MSTVAAQRLVSDAMVGFEEAAKQAAEVPLLHPQIEPAVAYVTPEPCRKNRL